MAKMINKYVQKASDLVTTHESQRNGFLEYALRKSKESIPYIDKAKALKLILEQKIKNPKDILKLDDIKSSCYEAAKEIFAQYSKGEIKNCANLTVEKQLVNLCNWIVTQK